LANCTDALAFHIFAVLEAAHRGSQIAQALVLRQIAQQFMSGVGVGGRLAAIEIDCECDIALGLRSQRPPNLIQLPSAAAQTYFTREPSPSTGLSL
jgi:hypothetical protein